MFSPTNTRRGKCKKNEVERLLRMYKCAYYTSLQRTLESEWAKEAPEIKRKRRAVREKREETDRKSLVVTGLKFKSLGCTFMNALRPKRNLRAPRRS